MNRTRLTILALATWACVLAAGCYSTSAQAPYRRNIRYRRVCVIEFQNRTPYSGEAEKFSRLFGGEFGRLTSATDVVVVPKQEFSELVGREPMTEGRLPLSVLTSARERYQADAVVIGSVDSYNPYWKVSLQVSMKVIDTASGEVPYQFSDEWDSGARHVQREIKRYYERNRERDECKYGPYLFEQSGRYFMIFVANSAAAKMADRL